MGRKYQKNIETKRTVLRSFKLSDSLAYYKIFSDPIVNEHLMWDGPSSEEEASSVITTFNQLADNNVIIPWAIELKESGQFIGNVILKEFDGKHTFLIENAKRATIGYSLSRNFWRQGVMQEVLEEVLCFVSKELAIHKLQAHVSPDNAPSIGLLEKLGFEKEGFLKDHMYNSAYNRYYDCLLYARIEY